jgi:23S rRNA (uridine2552-2'-O)-methyltransferase
MRELHDRYFRLAKREGRLARSHYKLQELDRRFRILKPGMRVLDLGAAPGSWLEYALEAVGPRGVLCAVDLSVIDKRFKGKVHFRKGDVREVTAETFRDAAERFDAVLSDMAPKTSGVRLADQGRSMELAETAWTLAREVLAPGGAFAVKVFESPELPALRKTLAPHFRALKQRKPDASRDESMETYLVGLGFGEAPERGPRAEERSAGAPARGKPSGKKHGRRGGPRGGRRRGASGR